jgi:hypothetical protein
MWVQADVRVVARAGFFVDKVRDAGEDEASGIISTIATAGAPQLR